MITWHTWNFTAVTDIVEVYVVHCRIICWFCLSLCFLWLPTCAYQDKPLDFTLTFRPKLLSVAHGTCATHCMLVRLLSPIYICHLLKLYCGAIFSRLSKKSILIIFFHLYLQAGFLLVTVQLVGHRVRRQMAGASDCYRKRLWCVAVSNKDSSCCNAAAWQEITVTVGKHLPNTHPHTLWVSSVFSALSTIYN